MSRSIEQVLEQCLDEVTRTGDIETALRRHPQYAEELGPLLEAAIALRQHYAEVPLPPRRLAAGRARMLVEAVHQDSQDVQTPIHRQSRRLVLAVQVIGVLLLIITTLAVASGGVVSAANESLPSDVLYPVKLSVEEVQLALAPTPGSQVDMALRFAAIRSAEVRSMAQSGLPVPDTTLERLEWYLQYALNRASTAQDQADTLLLLVAKQTDAEMWLLDQAEETTPPWTRFRIQQARQIYHQVYDAALEEIDR